MRLKGDDDMKVNIEVDCTPEEVRRLVGLPDLTPVHDAYLGRMKDSFAKGVTPELVEQAVRTWMPGGAQGVDFVRDLIGGLAQGAAKAKAKDKKADRD
jgi:hypothetical protein